MHTEHEATLHFTHNDSTSIGSPLYIRREYVSYSPAVESCISLLRSIGAKKGKRPEQYVVVYPDTPIGEIQSYVLQEKLNEHGGTIYSIHAPPNSTDFYFYDMVSPHTGPKPIADINVISAQATVRVESVSHQQLSLPEMDEIK